VNRLGNIDAAAHALAITIESMAYLPGYAFGVAAATLSGQFLGAHDERRARESVWMAAVGCVFLMTAVATVFYLSSDSLAAWFVGSTGHQDVAVLTAKLVRLVAFAQPPLAMLMVFSGALRGAGQTRVPMMVNFFGLLVVRLPLAMILAWPGVEIAGGVISLPGMNLGVVGAWLAMAADLTTRGLLMCAMFHWGTWSRVRV
jgi:Na+-driven multidrug efflux pump